MDNNINENTNNDYSSQYVYRADGTSYNASHIPPEKPQKPKRDYSILKKIGLSVGLGLLFGLSAAFAFLVMKDITGSPKSEISANVDMDEYTDRIEKNILEKISREKGRSDSADIMKGMDEREVAPQIVATDVTQVVEDVMPSVVTIVNNYTYTTNFFGRVYTQDGEASGSGIIIGENDEELLIATNNHVVDSADSLEVTFIDDSTAKAFVKGTDEDMDLAVVAVELNDLDEKTRKSIVIATLGDSDKLKVGEPAIAIGNALGYGQSVTTGVISALNRNIDVEDGSEAEGLIQTDAAINPGNSGGALLNMEGKVVGINSNKIGGSIVEGMGYAIPISKALPILDELKVKKTKVEQAQGERGYLGISGRGVSEELSEVYGFPVGVYVYEVYEGTGADFAGLKKGDIITKFDGSSVDSMESLHDLLDYYEAGEKVEITYMRADESGTYAENKTDLVLCKESQLPKE